MEKLKSLKKNPLPLLIPINKDNIVDSFEGKFRFLSNFWPAPTQYQGIIYPSAEHTYVASKTDDPELRKIVLLLEKPGEAKRLGRSFPIKKDWGKIKFGIMSEIVKDKFFRNQDLGGDLLATNSMLLIEGNWWGDVYWGICEGKGLNNLGKILMNVREQLRVQKCSLES